MKLIYSGLESSGKTLKLAMMAMHILERNAKWKEKSGVTRPIISNIYFSHEFEKYADELKIPIIYWENLYDLIKYDNCDVFIDEVGNYFDARMWTDLSLDVRRWLTQGAKSGVEIYGAAQDFAQVDKAFRRLVNHLYHITKLMGSRRPSATKPPVKFIWGICSMKELNPQGYDEEKSKFEAISPFNFSFFYIRKEFCEIFDTTQKIKKSKPVPFRHIARDCELEICDFHKIAHI